MRPYVTIVESVTTFHIFSYISGRNKKIFSCLWPGKMQKKSHPGGAPETKLYFFWPYFYKKNKQADSGPARGKHEAR